MTDTRQEFAKRVATAAQSVPGVTRLSAQSPVRIRTPFPGGAVDGVRIEPDRVTVGVVIDRFPLIDVADAVREAVTTTVDTPGTAVRIIVVDVDLDRLPSAAG
ncbi:hypothetical protein [Stackebrandtia soli]|uniref:hypothetical protein n=1 Tax=Stackebrandtia soli TaxID=1892856 RepID=UPI0039ECA221